MAFGCSNNLHLDSADYALYMQRWAQARQFDWVIPSIQLGRAKLQEPKKEETMAKFTVGDRVIYTSGNHGSDCQHNPLFSKYRTVGTIDDIRADGWIGVAWDSNGHNVYKEEDLAHYELPKQRGDAKSYDMDTCKEQGVCGMTDKKSDKTEELTLCSKFLWK